MTVILQYVTGELHHFVVHALQQGPVLLHFYCESNAGVASNLLWIYNVYCESNADE